MQESFIMKSPKRSPLVLRTIVLLFAIACGFYIFSVSVKQTITHTNSASLNVHVANVVEYFNFTSSQSCPHLNSQPWEISHAHFPKPKTFRRAECDCNPVRFFAILSTQRSGSGWFETLLNNHTNISSNGEIFSVKVRRSNITTIVETLDKVYNLDWFSSASKNECTAAVGFKWMLNQGLMQYHIELVEYFNRRHVLAIFLFRKNLLRRMVSILANSYDRNVGLLNGTHKSHVHSLYEAEKLAKYKPTLNVSSLIPSLRKVEETSTKALEFFNTTRHIVLYYEDIIKNRTILEDVQNALMVPVRELRSRQVKIHKAPLAEQIQNWGVVDTALRNSSYQHFLHTDYRL